MGGGDNCWFGTLRSGTVDVCRDTPVKGATVESKATPGETGNPNIRSSLYEESIKFRLSCPDLLCI